MTGWEQLSKRELIEVIKGLMKELRQLKKELGYEQSEKLSEMFRPSVPKDESPKKPGAKEGHEGTTRPTPERIDEKKEVGMRRCPKGHRVRKITEKRKRTVEDIVMVRKTKITEYELQGYYCATCKKKVFPKLFEAMHGFRLGMHFCNYVCERRFGYRMPFNLIQKDLLENFGFKVSQGTLVNAIRAVASLLGRRYDAYKQMLREGKFVHIDETGWRVAGTNRWLWKFRSADIVVTVISKNRNHTVPENVMGTDYDGTMIHDGFPAYNLLDAEHQQCWAHIGRHSKKAVEKYPTPAAKKFHDSLKRLYRDAKAAKKSRRTRMRFEARMRHLLKQRVTNPEHRRLKKFIGKHFDEMFVFVEKDIDGTNNAAERAIRNDVIVRKISGGNRSERGMRDYEVLSSVMQTCRLRNENFSEVVRNELLAAANG